MKKVYFIIFATITLAFALGTNAIATPFALSEANLDQVAGAEGLLIKRAAPPSDAALITEIGREILRRNAVTEYPVERVDMVFDRYNTLTVGKTSGKTISDLFAEGEPGRLPQFFIDEANRITQEKNPNYPLIPGQP